MSGPTISLDEQVGSGSGERERLGRFTLLRVVGRGASATVYEAMDTRMERPVALKVLSFDPMLSPEQRQRQIERFEREARAVARLSHPNIVSVYDVGEEAGKNFLVMELLSGVTLRERLDQGGPIALGEAASIIEQIASALDSTHAEGIVHRDIKPSNVLLMPDGRIKMLDFGIARRGEDATVTHTGMLIGSPAYMSPEQGRGENASPASDIWSLGALLYEMLTGQSPFGASNVAAVLYNAAYKEPEPLPADVSQVQKVVDHALAKQPEERYATAGALANALRVAVDFPSGPGSLKPAPTPTPSAVKQSLQSARITTERVSESTSESTSETLRRPRSRIADLGVIAAWAAVVFVALGIVTIRMRQSSTSAATKPVTNMLTGQTATSSTLPVTAIPSAAAPKAVRARPSPPPSPPPPTPTVQIAEIKPTPVTVATPVPAPTPTARTVRTVRTAARVKTIAAVPTPRPPEPTALVKAPAKKNVAVAVASESEPPWDDRIDRLGDPEPEPTPAKTPSVRQPQKVRQNRRPVQAPTIESEHSSETPQFKRSTLLGRWKGNIWKRSASLFVTGSDNDSFQGVLSLKTESGPIRFNIQGSFSPVTGRLSFWSSDAPTGGIDLGQENGRLISAKTMGGVGIDANRRVFTWSFSR